MSKFISLIFLFLITTCASKNGNILTSQSTNEFRVQLKSSAKNRGDIISIQLPQKLTINNSNSSTAYFNTIDYLYQDSLSKWANRNISLYKFKDRKLEKKSNFKRKNISPKKSSIYIFYTRHFIDSSKSTQQQFKPYVEKMLKENKDTLHIGTITEFKQKHKELFKKLTKNDSISIQFLDGKKLGERITVPVEW